MLDGASQAAVMDNLREEFRARALIWVVHRPSDAARFDQVLVMKDGKLAESGTFAELMDRTDSVLASLVAHE